MDLISIAYITGILTVVLFGLSTVSYKMYPQYSHILTTISLSIFSLFWVSLFPYYVFQTRSFVYGILIVTGVPLTLYIAYQYYHSPEKYTTMPQVVTFIFIASVLYAPLELSTSFRQAAIELIAYQTYYIIQLFGIDVELITGPDYGYMSALAFPNPDPSNNGRLITYIEPACTGLGSMAVLIGLISINKISLGKKIGLIAVSVVVIHILNIIRNVFIAVGYGLQWFQFYPETVQRLLQLQYESLVSFIIADKVIAQLLSAIVLVILIYVLTYLIPPFKKFLVTFIEEWVEPVLGKVD